MLSTATALALLTLGSCLIVYQKLPRRLRKFLEKHSLMTDFLSLIGIYFLLGGTLTALFAASICSLMISALLHIKNNEQDFLYLFDLQEFISNKLDAAKEMLNKLGKDYREQKNIEPKKLESFL